MSLLDTRVRQAIDQVGDDVEDDDQGGGEEEDAQQQVVVALHQCLVHQAADAGPGEHGLGEDGAAHHLARLQAGESDDGKQGIAQDMPSLNHPWTEALGAGGLDIVLLAGLEHGRTGHAGINGHEEERQGGGGQDQVLGHVEHQAKPSSPAPTVYMP
ncbi:hypothetical protein Q427_31770 [Halomonas sp. BC04]|nr:hypothetical protein Q427_31770 [Halomonas sp. BC04]